MEVCENDNSPRVDGKPELGFPSPPLEASNEEALESELRNLLLKDERKRDDDASSEVSSPASRDDKKKRFFHYPRRPGEPDCAFYMRTGSCRYGMNCKFNHPPRHKNQVGMEMDNVKEGSEKGKEEDWNDEDKESEEMIEKESSEKEGQQECKYYLTAGGCKFGKACRYKHSRDKAGSGEHVALNFCGLPLRPGEKRCPFYMRTGSCKFATNCKFHHPDPGDDESDRPPVYQNESSLPLRTSVASSQLPTSWPLQRTQNEPVPYIEASPQPFLPVMLSPPQGVHPSPEWNGYIGASPLFSAERHMQAPLASSINDFSRKTDSSTRQLQTTVDEFPERPGQPECQFYLKNGDCKYKSACRFHHPKNRISKPPSCVLSPLGLPLRPDQIICTHYSRYGICKFGPSCKFDHPMNVGPASPAPPVSSQLTTEKPLSEKAKVPKYENGTEVQN